MRKKLIIIILILLMLISGILIYFINSPFKTLFDNGYNIKEMTYISKNNLIDEFLDIKNTPLLKYAMNEDENNIKDYKYFLLDNDSNNELIYPLVMHLKDNNYSEEESNDILNNIDVEAYNYLINKIDPNDLNIDSTITALNSGLSKKDIDELEDVLIKIINDNEYAEGYKYLKDNYSNKDISIILNNIKTNDLHYLNNIKYISNLKDLVNQKDFNFNLLPRYLLALKEDKTDINNVIKLVNNNEDYIPENEIDYSSLYKNIKEIEDPNYIVLLANKENKLPDGYEPDDLIYLPIEYVGNNHPMRKEAGESLIKMIEEAPYPGIKAHSNYRSFNTQTNLYNNYVARDGVAAADRYSSRPGHSEHQTGLTSDLSYYGGSIGGFPSYPGYDWVLKNAHDYGFILRYPENKEFITGFEYENWHFRYVGKDAATIIYNNDWTLEEYKMLYD